MCARKDQKTMSDPLELKLHKAVSNQVWVLGTELGSFMSYPVLQSLLFNLVVSSCYFSSLHSVDTNCWMYRQLFFHSVCCVFTPGWFPLLCRSLLSTWDPLSVVDLTSHIRGVLLSPHLCLQAEVFSLFDSLNSFRVNKIVKLEKKETHWSQPERQMLQFYVDATFASSLCLTWSTCENQVITNRKWRLRKGTMKVIWRQNEKAEGGKVQTWRGGEGLAKMCYKKAIKETYDLAYQVQKVEGIEHW